MVRLSSSCIRYVCLVVTQARQVLNRGRSAFLAANRDKRGGRRKKVKCTKRRHLSLCFGSERCARMHLDID